MTVQDSHEEVGSPNVWKPYSVERCPECSHLVKLPLDGNEVECPGCGIKLCLLYEEEENDSDDNP